MGAHLLLAGLADHVAFAHEDLGAALPGGVGEPGPGRAHVVVIKAVALAPDSDDDFRTIVRRRSGFAGRGSGLLLLEGGGPAAEEVERFV